MLGKLIEPGKRGLFCDDDPFFTTMGEDSLSGARFFVTTAANGQEALALLSKHPFDLVILDVHIPGISGFSVLEEIRVNETTKNLAVMVVTGNDDSESIQKAFHLCANSFMAKPFDWSLLVHRVQFLLKAARMEQELRDSMRATELMRKMQQEFLKTLMEAAQRPLKTASHFAQFLKLESHGPLGSDFYKSCVDEFRKAIECVNDTHLRLVCRADSQAMVDKMEEDFDLWPHLTNIVLWLEDEAPRRKLDVATAFDIPELLRIKYDPVLLIHALKSALSHAIEMSQRGSKIELGCRLDNKSGLLLTISNTADVSPSATSPSKSRAEGDDTMLHFSLQMSQTIAEAHGGDVWMIPQLNNEKLVSISIPAERLIGNNRDDVPTDTTGGPSAVQPVGNTSANPQQHLRKSASDSRQGFESHSTVHSRTLA